MKNILSKLKAYLCVCLLLLIVSCHKKEATYYSLEAANKGLKVIYTQYLDTVISSIDSLAKTNQLSQQKEYYKKARKYFKLLEPVLAYSDKNNYKSLNAPNILKVEEEDLTNIKVIKPFGFQVIEETLYEETIDTAALKKSVDLTNNRLKLIRNNIHIDLKEYHVIWLLREQLVRIATTGITGFDSPVLNQSLEETILTYQTILRVVNLHKDKFASKELLKTFTNQIEKAQKALKHEFDTFDRFDFIKSYINPQLETLVKVQEDWKVTFPFTMALSNNLTSLFSEDALNIGYFSDYKNDTVRLTSKVALGKALFNDVSLSKDNTMACATCHAKDFAFTDGKRVFDNRQTRNTPTVTYAAFQRGFFMDARSGSLEGQVVGVVENHNEFNMTMDSVVNRVIKNEGYKQKLKELYGNKRIDYNIRNAIASYIRTLNPFNSKFDKNIRGEETTLTQEEKDGFNLFTGKALCATCHFSPVFNGTVPPNYNDTELEAIGVPNIDLTGLSEDLGRYNFFKTNERKHFFKTPSIRNIAKTAPYMHNGVYKTLEEVVEFYNNGGGEGLGFSYEYQTLPADSLGLTKKEIKSIVAFMKTLTDEDY
ncbi:cytochrome c peroxidase [Tenacibaculum sp. 190524A02b]|uniref:Cytochrome c peroxidase n=1 Tax=Tenacibaculum vairaonense TaxID=3137860 RepID=A0ABP1FGF3_9FLAO